MHVQRMRPWGQTFEIEFQHHASRDLRQLDGADAGTVGKLKLGDRLLPRRAGLIRCRDEKDG